MLGPAGHSMGRRLGVLACCFAAASGGELECRPVVLHPHHRVLCRFQKAASSKGCCVSTWPDRPDPPRPALGSSRLQWLKQLCLQQTYEQSWMPHLRPTTQPCCRISPRRVQMIRCGLVSVIRCAPLLGLQRPEELVDELLRAPSPARGVATCCCLRSGAHLAVCLLDACKHVRS